MVTGILLLVFRHVEVAAFSKTLVIIYKLHGVTPQ